MAASLTIATTAKEVGVPAVRWSDQYGQYFTRIGYNRSRSGKRQRAFHYLGRDLKGAIAKAVGIKTEWRMVKRSGPAAVWLTAKSAPSGAMAKMTPQQVQVAIEKYHLDADADALELGQSEQTPTLRLEQVRDDYVEYRRAKMGMGDGQGINAKSFRNECRNLSAAVAVADEKMTVNGLEYAEIERVRDSIFRRVGANEISKRTANNYWNEFRRMLDWAHRSAKTPYRHPEDVGVLFKARFKNANPVNITEYDAAQFRKMLKSATDRQRLYIYLALNCGHYQVDIGNLRTDEIVTIKGKTAIVRRRSKTAHQNDFESVHVLWDETSQLLKQEMAKKNVMGLALLSERGTSLYRAAPHFDSVTDTLLALRKRSGVTLPFKQFRKIGATAIQRLGGDEARRLYKAGTIDSGDKVYVREAWEKLTPYLEKWGEELRCDNVLCDTQDGSN